MQAKMIILSQGYNEFYNKCHSADSGHFCGDSSSSDTKFEQFSERGRRRAADIKAGKEFKPLPNAKFNSELDNATSWPEKWVSEAERRTGKFAVSTFLKGEGKTQAPLSYADAVKTYNLPEISRTGKNGQKEYLSPDANHLTARIKAIGLDKILSPKELSRMVREDKPIWVDSTSVNNWRFYKVPKTSEEIGVALSKNGTIGTVIPGGYQAMAIDEAGKGNPGSSQLGRLLMWDRVTKQHPSNETVTPTVKITPITIGKTTLRQPKRRR